MKALLIILYIFSATLCFGQTASFKEIKLKPNPKYYSPKGATIIFPLVLTGNSQTDALINSQVKEDLFQPDSENQSVKSLLNEHINEYGLINLSYKVTYNSAGILSFSIYTEGCGAYCSSSTSYFNFDLSIGKKISVYDLFLEDKIDSFKNIARSDKINSLLAYKTEEKNALLNGQIDSVIYDWAISEVDENCINQLSIEDFVISGNAIEIIDPCEFPHIIRSQEPGIELKYTYNTIAGFLTPRFKELLK